MEGADWAFWTSAVALFVAVPNVFDGVGVDVVGGVVVVGVLVCDGVVLCEDDDGADDEWVEDQVGRVEVDVPRGALEEASVLVCCAEARDELALFDEAAAAAEERDWAELSAERAEAADAELDELDFDASAAGFEL